MAAKKSTSGTRSSKNSKQKPAVPVFDSGPLLGYVEDQCSRLMDAEAVLDCALVAMEEEGHVDPEGPYYPGVMRAARDIMSDVVKQLDSEKLQAVIESAGDEADSGEEYARGDLETNKNDGVKEAPAAYVH
jgi:hypothetical protein